MSGQSFTLWKPNLSFHPKPFPVSQKANRKGKKVKSTSQLVLVQCSLIQRYFPRSQLILKTLANMECYNKVQILY